MNIGIAGFSAAALIATLWMVAPASAQDKPPPHHGGHHSMMKAADTDGDGRISRAEADAQRSKVFSELDEDGDGAVTRDMFVAKKTDRIMKRMSRQGIEERVGYRFDKIDENGDKILSLDEFSSRGRAHFDRMDADGDGFLSPDERPHRRFRHSFGPDH